MKHMLYAVCLFVSFCLIMSFTYDRCDAKQMYKYKDENGNWSFTDNPALVPHLEKAETRNVRNRDADIIGNLEKKLRKRARPKNKIEEARIATVAIKSSIGVGSGFFVTVDGFLLTNKHVIAPGRDAEVRIEKIEKQLKEAKAQLEKEHNNILQMKRRLKNWEKHESYAEKKKSLIKWTKDYEKRKKLFQDKRQEFEDFKLKTSYPDDLKIFLVDDTVLPVSIVSTSYIYDLALLRLAGYRTPFIEPADVKLLSHGETLYAIGSPMGLYLRHTVTSGIFSGLREFKEGPHEAGTYIQTNAQINKGNSGGPLITQEGKVIGINTWKFAGQKVEGLGFAIPIYVALDEFETYLGKHDESDR
ncbi:MAG: trypsin-like peptidase domain-containing protein [Deltaproteobacteria bacterium]|nr:trypsin-like peptidase domain-containing protein [Deltaproteobacteria bacterium]MBW2344962.1 trypsin-like peptidase domain-containing protein [Deltaproteobacteria bacterium]